MAEMSARPAMTNRLTGQKLATSVIERLRAIPANKRNAMHQLMLDAVLDLKPGEKLLPAVRAMARGFYAAQREDEAARGTGVPTAPQDRLKPGTRDVGHTMPRSSELGE